MHAAAAEDFPGNERFAIRHRLGAGGFGVVYEAYDRERRAVVALKVLRDAGADALYRFKQEFRALADIVHPNLVSLYELASEGDRWFFTMELVRGATFLEHVWSGEGREPGLLYRHTDSMTAPTSRVVEAPTLRAVVPPAAVAGRPLPASMPADLDRLRATLRQLGAGLMALHAAGKLHRDLKPPNVLITREGRVVILDFGLVAEAAPEALFESGTIVGTPAYMSPEQGGGGTVTEASDWYAVGTMLFQALTGQVPFTGSYVDVLLAKRSSESRPPAELIAGVPPDLNELCRDLLRIAPARRPRGADFLKRLGGAPPEGAISAPASSSLVGRARQLRALEDSFLAAQEGRAATVFVTGRSGMGKTALLRHFVEELRRRGEALVLQGRCYEQESVPYKALDSIVDALSRYLKRLDPLEVEALLPRDVLALGRLFPVLRRMEAVSGTRHRPPALNVPDPQELRTRAFAALRELFWRLAARQNLVLVIDDVQWGDADSAALLTELVRPPDPPPMLLLASYRIEEVETSPLLRALLPAVPAMGDVREVAVAELDPEEARELAARLIGAKDGRAEQAARESGGNPFFLDELARREGVAAAGAGTTLGELILGRVAQLAPEARRLLEVLAVAGQPVELAAALGAAGLEAEGHVALGALRTQHLVRTGGTRDKDQIETYHDRIRETVASSLPGETRRERHRQLAEALELTGRADPETLAAHLKAAGEGERAGLYAAQAAARAFEALAFDRAARLYRFALEQGRPDPSSGQPLQVRLGDALANAGRGGEAAIAYAAAAETATGAFALELRRRVAEQHLISGHIDEGVAALGAVFRLLRMRLPRTPRRALASLLLRRALLRARGLRFREREAARVGPEKLIRIDTCWSVTIGLTFVDTIRGGEFQTRHLLLALRAGEPYRVARALALEAGHSALGGGRTRARTEQLVARLRSIAERIRHPHALALTALGDGVAAYLQGRFRPALETLDRAEQMLRDSCTGVTWERDNAQLYAIRALWLKGELAEMARRLRAFLKDSERRGDRYAATHAARMSSLARLVADRPKDALRELDQGIERWTQRGFLLQHYWDWIGRIETALYAGDSERAGRLMDEGWPRVRGSLLMRIQFVLITAFDLRARTSLARGVTPPALESAGRLTRERMAWAVPLARLVEAGAASLSGERDRARALLVSAEQGFAAADMALHVAVARRCRGHLESARELVDAAEAWMAAEGVRSPERLTRMIAPGRWRD